MSVGRSVGLYVCIGRSALARSSKRGAHQSINRSNHQSINQSIQSINQSANQPSANLNQSANQMCAAIRRAGKKNTKVVHITSLGTWFNLSVYLFFFVFVFVFVFFVVWCGMVCENESVMRRLRICSPPLGGLVWFGLVFAVCNRAHRFQLCIILHLLW